MRWLGGLSLMILFLVGMGLYLWYDWRKVDRFAAPSFEDRSIRLGFTVKNNTNELIERAEFKTFAPISDSDFQEVLSISSNQEFIETRDDSGNQALLFAINNLPPFGTRAITITARVRIWTLPHSNNSLPTGVSLNPNESQLNHAINSAVSSIDVGFEGGPGLDWLRAANNWIYENLNDVGYIAEDRGALFALTERKGDCTEFMHALVALSRSADIPAIPVAGFRVTNESSLLRAADYHNWAMFLLGERWGLADPHGNVFNSNQSQYVAFRLLKNGVEGAGFSERFYTHDERLRVSMN